jgi:hypothetical protein
MIGKVLSLLLLLLLFFILGLVKLLPGGSGRLNGLPLVVFELIRLEQALNYGLLLIILIVVIIFIVFRVDSLPILAAAQTRLRAALLKVSSEDIEVVLVLVTPGLLLVLLLEGALRLCFVVVLELLGPLGFEVLEGTAAELRLIPIIDVPQGTLGCLGIICGGGLV